MRISLNFVLAGVVFALLLFWVGSGMIGDNKANGAQTPGEQAELVEKEDSQLFKVRVQKLKASPQNAEQVIRGRTESFRSVQVPAETNGVVAKIHAEKGQSVREGDLLCELAIDARAAKLAEARAGLTKAKLDKDGALKLAEKGFKSQTQVAAAQAAYDASLAAVRQMEIEIGRTKIKAPFDGVVNDRYVEVGDYLQSGNPCALVVDLDPLLVVGSVSEREVMGLKVGDVARVRLLDNTEYEGTVRFVSSSAELATRTFRVEVELPNPDGAIKDGITAEIRVSSKAVLAHKISPAILTLDEAGVVGVRTVDDQNIVHFAPIHIISDSPAGVWVTGLPETVTVINVGQEYVSAGQKVEVESPAEEVKS